jgi:ribonucleoside-diphosphate reductase alpha chain
MSTTLSSQNNHETKLRDDNTLPAEQEISGEVLLEKYAKGNEQNVHDVRARVARALAAVEAEDKRAIWEAKFLEAQESGFVPAGRINSAAGTDLQATLINCFVQPVGDSISEASTAVPASTPRWRRPPRPCAAAAASATTSRRSARSAPSSRARIRAPRARCRTCACSTARARRWNPPARAAAPRWACCAATIRTSRCSSTPRTRATSPTSTSPSASPTLFMQAVEIDGDVELAHKAEPSADIKTAGAYQREDGSWVYRKVRARELWDQIMRSTYDHAEPGILFLDRINRDNNLNYCETIEATNPCAEQPLPPYGCC